MNTKIIGNYFLGDTITCTAKYHLMHCKNGFSSQRTPLGIVEEKDISSSNLYKINIRGLAYIQRATLNDLLVS